MSKEETQQLIGQKLTRKVYRDAIHIAVLPVYSGDEDFLQPGDKVEIIQGTNTVRLAKDTEGIGIVDPFLKEPVMLGESFFVFMYPNTVNGMRHAWQHPTVKFADGEEKIFVDVKAAERWLRDFAARWVLDFNDMIAEAKTVKGEIFGGTEIYDIRDTNEYNEFWDNLEIYTGKEFSNEHRESVSWSCSC